jgi:hypothetical protein
MNDPLDYAIKNLGEGVNTNMQTMHLLLIKTKT